MKGVHLFRPKPYETPPTRKLLTEVQRRLSVTISELEKPEFVAAAGLRSRRKTSRRSHTARKDFREVGCSGGDRSAVPSSLHHLRDEGKRCGGANHSAPIPSRGRQRQSDGLCVVAQGRDYSFSFSLCHKGEITPLATPCDVPRARLLLQLTSAEGDITPLATPRIWGEITPLATPIFSTKIPFPLVSLETVLYRSP